MQVIELPEEKEEDFNIILYMSPPRCWPITARCHREGLNQRWDSELQMWVPKLRPGWGQRYDPAWIARNELGLLP